jgi:hypothetical protein
MIDDVCLSLVKVEYLVLITELINVKQGLMLKKLF